jgi:hypothetical protein
MRRQRPGAWWARRGLSQRETVRLRRRWRQRRWRRGNWRDLSGAKIALRGFLEIPLKSDAGGRPFSALFEVSVAGRTSLSYTYRPVFHQTASRDALKSIIGVLNSGNYQRTTKSPLVTLFASSIKPHSPKKRKKEADGQVTEQTCTNRKPTSPARLLKQLRLPRPKSQLPYQSRV